MGQSDDLGRIDADAAASAGNTMDRMGSGIQPLPAQTRDVFNFAPQDGRINGSQPTAERVIERPAGNLSAPVVGTTGSVPNLDSTPGLRVSVQEKLSGTGAGSAPRTSDLDATLDSLFGK